MVKINLSVHFNFIIPIQPVDKEGGDPTEDKDTDDNKSENAEIVIQNPDRSPKGSLQFEVIADQSQGLDAADNQRHQHRNKGDGHVVVELPDRFHERPAVSAKHQDAVGGINQRHSGGKKRRKNQD